MLQSSEMGSSKRGDLLVSFAVNTFFSFISKVNVVGKLI